MNSYAARNDPFFLGNSFEIAGRFGFSLIKRQKLNLSNLSLMPYNLTKPNDIKHKECGIHFFIDDYRFEHLYSNLEKTFNRVCGYKFLLTPEFSLYREMPLWKIVENVGKSRYCGAYWQHKGKTVIPALNWSGTSSIEICLSAIEKGCVIAVSTVGCRSNKLGFLEGYNQILKTIEPPKIICVGKPFKEMQGDIITIEYSRTKPILTEKSILANTDLHKDCQLSLPFIQKNKITNKYFK